MSSRDFNFHLGDNANYDFGDDSVYVGMAVDLPIILGTPQGTPKLIIHTSAVDTYADWQSHTVHIDGYLLGYIRDASGQPNETHEFPVPAAMIDGASRRLVIRVVGKGPGLEDDFVLKRIESHDFDLHFGWV
jgi:hypothetical protein